MARTRIAAAPGPELAALAHETADAHLDAGGFCFAPDHIGEDRLDLRFARAGDDMIGNDNEAMDIAYLGLGRLIARQCPAGFSKAVLGMEIDGEHSRLWIVSTQQDGTEVHMPPDDAAARDILESLRGIRKAMAEEDGRLWRSCTVTLRKGGGFAMEVEY